MKRHIHTRSANKMVMFALVAVLLISLGYLMTQTKEGFKEGAEPAFKSTTPEPKESPTANTSATKPLKRSCSLDTDKNTYPDYTSCNDSGGTWGF